MRNFLIVVAIIVAALLIFPFALGLCAFRIDRFDKLEGQTEIEHPPITVSFSAIRCFGPRGSSFPGFLAPNDIANGFQVRWELGNYSTKQKLTISDIKAELIDSVPPKVLDVPFSQWERDYNTSNNICYAFVSMGGYPSELPLGAYHIRLSYQANDKKYTDDFKFSFTENRKFGFHTFFYSNYF